MHRLLPKGLGGCLDICIVTYVHATLILHAPPYPSGFGGCLVVCAMPLTFIIKFALAPHAPSKPTGFGGLPC